MKLVVLLVVAPQRSVRTLRVSRNDRQQASKQL
jgi:hypothetical protein